LKVADLSTYKSDKAPAAFGPAFELRLPLGVGGEAGLLYRRIEYSSGTDSRTTAQAWEIPLLFKYRAPGAHLRPFLAAGFSYRRLAGLKQRTAAPGSAAASSGEPEEARGRSTAGPTLAGGMELQLPGVRLSAELRYTRWGSSSFKSALGGLATQLNQADLLLGIMF
jgi:hypothetical protein